MEADLQRYYRIDLRDLWRGRLTWRRLGVLIRHLPPESATVSALAPELVDVQADSGRAPRQWSPVEHRLVDIFEAVLSLRHVLMQVNSKHTIPAPKPVSRPGIKAGPRRASAHQLARIRRINHGR